MTDYILKCYEGDAGTAVEEFSDEESSIISPSVTNIDSNVFVWKISNDVNPEQIGALLSRYSRTSLTGRRLFLKEFYPNKNRGKEFFDAWLVDYGDDSIQEMVGGIPSACEYVSNVAVKEIEDARQAASFIEKSSRYVAFDKKFPNGEFMFYKDPDILNSRHADSYLKLMRALFTSYSENIEKMSALIKDKNPIDNISFRINEKVIKISELTKEIEEMSGITEADLVKSYDNAIKANALDFLRDYLPMSTLTHVGISMNGRSYENMLHKMLSSPLAESRFIAKRLHAELSKVVPSIVKRIDDNYGNNFQAFLSMRRKNSEEYAQQFTSGLIEKGPGVDLVEFKGIGSSDPEKSMQATLVTAILYKSSEGASIRQVQEVAEKMSEEQRKEIISKYVGARTNRRHKPGRAFESAEYLFDLKGRVGIYRDLQRHRIGLQERQMFSTRLGYETRNEFDDIGIGDDYRQKMKEVSELYEQIREKMPYQAQYVVTYGYNVRWSYRFSARQLYHLCELRSSQQGHPDYRKIVQEMAMKVKQVHPTIINHMNYLDMSEKTLGRLDSEVRIAMKKSQAQKQKS